MISAQFVVPTRKKKFKKGKKKACQTVASSARGELGATNGLISSFKKNQKSEKKACQGLRNLISLPKPNQTNGETND